MTKPENLQGHRAVGHTADVSIEAWAPTRAGCYAEAVHALVDTFADTSEARVTESLTLDFDPSADDELLVTLLEEVIFLVDARGAVPAGAVVEETPDGGLRATLDLVAVDEVTAVGAAPKAIARADLAVGFDGELWTCRATIDV